MLDYLLQFSIVRFIFCTFPDEKYQKSRLHSSMTRYPSCWLGKRKRHVDRSVAQRRHLFMLRRAFFGRCLDKLDMTVPHLRNSSHFKSTVSTRNLQELLFLRHKKNSASPRAILVRNCTEKREGGLFGFVTFVTPYRIFMVSIPERRLACSGVGVRHARRLCVLFSFRHTSCFCAHFASG